MKNKEFSEESSIAYFLASLNYLYDNLLLSPINLEVVSYHLVFLRWRLNENVIEH